MDIFKIISNAKADINNSNLNESQKSLFNETITNHSPNYRIHKLINFLPVLSDKINEVGDAKDKVLIDGANKHISKRYNKFVNTLTILVDECEDIINDKAYYMQLVERLKAFEDDRYFTIYDTLENLKVKYGF